VAALTADWHKQPIAQMYVQMLAASADYLAESNALTPVSSLAVADCAPGYYLNGTQAQASAICLTCTKGKFCEYCWIILVTEAAAGWRMRPCVYHVAGGVWFGVSSSNGQPWLRCFSAVYLLMLMVALPFLLLLNGCCTALTGAGGDANSANSPATDCPTGLATKFTGAKSSAQCFTQEGYGRKSTRDAGTGVVSYTGVICPVATYNVGGNTAGCQKCGAGLTTDGTGKSNATRDCCKHVWQLCV